MALLSVVGWVVGRVPVLVSGVAVVRRHVSLLIVGRVVNWLGIDIVMNWLFIVSLSDNLVAGFVESNSVFIGLVVVLGMGLDCLVVDGGLVDDWLVMVRDSLVIDRLIGSGLMDDWLVVNMLVVDGLVANMLMVDWLV